MAHKLRLAVVGACFDNVKRKGKPTGSRQMTILLCKPGWGAILPQGPWNLANSGRCP